jgi:hypothetical protein
LAKIETIRDLVNSQMGRPKAEETAQTAILSPRQKLAANRSAAAEFLGVKPKEILKTPVSLRKKIEKQNSFINPDSHFQTPTLLRNLGKNPDASVDVAQAQTILSKAEVTAEAMQAELKKNGAQNPQKLVRAVRQNSSFSRIPRTIENLIK